MKICLISEYFYPDNTGGTGTVLSHLARYLKDHYADLEIDVITSKNLYRGEAVKLPRQENWDGIRIFRLHTPKSNRPSTALRLVAGLVFTAATFGKLLRSRRYDVVFLVTNPPTLPMAVRAYGKLRRTPYVYLIHDLYPDVAVSLQVLRKESRIARVFAAMQRKWLHGAHHVIVLGRCMRDYLAEQYQLPIDQTEVITNWADADSIHALSKETGFRRKNKIDGFVVLYAGNFGQYQNFDGILQAAKVLLEENSPVTFVFVGDGARKTKIADWIEKEKLSNVRMLPFVPREEFSDMLASADVSLVTLEPGAEGLGVPSKFYNILASGRATLALMSPECEVARVLKEAHCGVTLHQDDAAGLVETIKRLMNFPQELEQMNANARRVFEQKYTLPHVAEQFYKVFQEVNSSRR
jgi:glycosyltransferase involved in cell wall biosynthesis